MSINIRSATIEDVDAIANVFVASVRIGSANYTNEQIETIITHFYEQSDLLEIEISVGTVFVAEAETIVGFASLSECGRAISNLFVHPDYVRQGIGTLLLSAIEKIALQKQTDRLWVMSSLMGRPFYLSRGYEYVKDSALIDGSTQIRVPCVDLVKDLHRDRNFRSRHFRSGADLSTLTVSQFLRLARRILLGS